MGLLARICDKDGSELASATVASQHNRDIFIAVAKAMERFRLEHPSRRLITEINAGCIIEVKAAPDDTQK